MAEVSRPGERYRRAPGLVMYWVGDQPVCFAWQRSARIPVTVEAIAVLGHLSDWTTVEGLASLAGGDQNPEQAKNLLLVLMNIGLVESDREPASSAGWQQWSPEAAFFHFSTKNMQFPEDLAEHDRTLRAKAAHDPPPAPTKRMEGERAALPASVPVADLESALRRRRTWRRFSNEPVSAAALGTLLRLTFKVQARGVVEGQGEVILKTSPSGGARHPIEAYVIALNIAGLPAGAYHYDCAADELVRLASGPDKETLSSLLAHQSYFAEAGAIVILCPVFERTMWRYPHGRAYRTVLIEAGHLGQTFCLLASALGLAPFSTMAFGERAIETLLGLDGISESPVYVVGVGTRDHQAADNPGRIRET